jgi:drug/metabolite transporter (DMT)-like permease
LETVSASIERLILCLYPTLTVLLSAWLMKTSISRRMWSAMALTYCGMVLVLAPDFAGARLDLLGMLFIVASTVSYAFYLTWCPPVIKRIGSMRFAELALTVSAIAMFIHYLLTRPLGILIHQPLPVWGYGLIMALVATVLPLYALSAAMARIGAGKTALIGSVGPILTIFLSIGILDEHLSPLQWAGVGVVLTGIWLVGQRKT